MPKVRSSNTHIDRLADLTPDPQNANLGTARGREALAQSLREFGPGRAVLIDRHGNIIAGNKTVEEAKRLNIPLQVVKTDGQVLSPSNVRISISSPTLARSGWSSRITASANSTLSGTSTC
jgi:hypothetical protein